MGGQRVAWCQSGVTHSSGLYGSKAPRRGPVRGPGHQIIPVSRALLVRFPVLSVQLARMLHEAALLIIRRSWVRAPPAPPAVSMSNEAGNEVGGGVYCVPVKGGNRIRSHRATAQRVLACQGASRGGMAGSRSELIRGLEAPRVRSPRWERTRRWRMDQAPRQVAVKISPEGEADHRCEDGSGEAAGYLDARARCRPVRTAQRSTVSRAARRHARWDDPRGLDSAAWRKTADRRGQGRRGPVQRREAGRRPTAAAR